MDFKHKPSAHYQNGNNYMEHQPQHQHRMPYNELSTNQSLLHHINTTTANKQHQEQHQQHLMDANEYQNQQKYHQNNMYVKSHYHSPKSRHLRRRARSECLSPSRSPQHYQNHSSHQERLNLKNHASAGYAKEQLHGMDLWRIHRRDEPLKQYRETIQYQHELPVHETYKHRFHNLQIDGKSVQFEELEPARDEMDGYNSWHQRRRFRASSESASQDYYYRESYPDVEDVRAKKTRDSMSSPVKERRSVPSHHVTNPKNSFSVLVNNTTHYRYSPKSKVRSHYVGHKVGVVRVSSPLHKARMQMWKSQSSSTSNSIPSTESNSTPETPQIDDDDQDIDDDDDDEDPPYGPGDQIDDDMTDPEDNYETSLSVNSSVATPAPTINTDCVHGGRVLSSPFAPSLFPFVPPYITFATFDEKGPEIPPVIHKQLKWKLTTITPLLVRKVILNTGFRLMKSEYDVLSDVLSCTIPKCFQTPLCCDSMFNYVILHCSFLLVFILSFLPLKLAIKTLSFITNIQKQTSSTRWYKIQMRISFRTQRLGRNLG